MARYIYIYIYNIGGDLFDMLKKKREAKERFKESQILQIMSEICSGVSYCHLNKIAHKDLKPKNILIVDGIPKLCDFGIARNIKDTEEVIKTKRLTVAYAAPEVFNTPPFKPKLADIWSLGCLLYELCSLKRPFLPGFNMNYKFDVTPLDAYSLQLRELITLMLNVDPEARPTADQILSTIPYIYNFS